MTDRVRWGRKGRVLALAGSLVYSVCAFAQDPDPEPDPQPPWLERVIQALERVEAEQQALRQEVEALLVRQDEPQVQEMEHSAVESEPAVEGGEDSTPSAELVEQDPGVPADSPDAEAVATSEPVPDPEESEAPAAPEEKVFSPQITQPAARLYGQGREAFRNLNFYDAAKAFREFLTKYPAHEDAGEARYWLGETLYVEGRFQEAIAAFAEVIADEANPRREVARLKTGYAWFELGDFERAEVILTEVRDQNPGSDLARLAQLRLDRLQRRADGE